MSIEKEEYHTEDIENIFSKTKEVKVPNIEKGVPARFQEHNRAMKRQDKRRNSPHNTLWLAH